MQKVRWAFVVVLLLWLAAGVVSIRAQNVVCDANVTGECAVAGGGGSLTVGTTPIVGGNNYEVLFNQSGVVHTSSDFAFVDGGSTNYLNIGDGTGVASYVNIISGTVTANTPPLSMTQTWNNSGVDFMGLDLNITNTASKAGSRLMRLRVGNTSMLDVDRSGRLTAAGGADIASDIYSPYAFFDTLEATATTFNAVTYVPTPFASLGTPTDGTVMYCSDCTLANPCASGGSGAIAKRLNSAWVCN